MTARGLTSTQCQSLRDLIDTRIARLQADIANALRQPDNPGVVSFANHFEETDDAAVATLELATEVAATERDSRELRTLLDARAHLDSEQAGKCCECGEMIP